MAIHIPMVRVRETQEIVVYRYDREEWIADPARPSRRMFVSTFFGMVELDKATGSITRTSGAEWDKNDFYFSRVQRVLRRCHSEGSYPEQTSYAA